MSVSASLSDMIFILHFAYVVYYANQFVDIEPALHPANESYLIVAYDLFNVLVNFYTGFHRGYTNSHCH